QQIVDQPALVQGGVCQVAHGRVPQGGEVGIRPREGQGLVRAGQVAEVLVPGGEVRVVLAGLGSGCGGQGAALVIRRGRLTVLVRRGLVVLLGCVVLRGVVGLGSAVGARVIPTVLRAVRRGVLIVLVRRVGRIRGRVSRRHVEGGSGGDQQARVDRQ